MKDLVIIPYVYSNSLQLVFISNVFPNLNSSHIFISIRICYSYYFTSDLSLEIPGEHASIVVYIKRIIPNSDLDNIYLFQPINRLNTLF